MSSRFQPMTKAVTQQLLKRTMAELKADLEQAKAGRPETAINRRCNMVEIALARVVGAIGGQEAENELTALLEWSDADPFNEGLCWNFGRNARSFAEHAAAEVRRA